jgi:hypothetical protein
LTEEEAATPVPVTRHALPKPAPAPAKHELTPTEILKMQLPKPIDGAPLKAPLPTGAKAPASAETVTSSTTRTIR